MLDQSRSQLIPSPTRGKRLLGGRLEVGNGKEQVVSGQLLTSHHDIPSGKRPLFPFVKCFPKNHPSPNSSSLSTSSTRSPLAKVSSSELRAVKSSVGVGNNRVSSVFLLDSHESGRHDGPHRKSQQDNNQRMRYWTGSLSRPVKSPWTGDD